MDIQLTKPQYEMMQMRDNRVPFPLFCGGYGCGKSHILVFNVIRDLFSFPGVKVGCYAPTHDLLSLNLVPRIIEVLESFDIEYKHNKSNHILSVGNNQIIFRSMNDPARIVAYEVYASHVDEADLMPTTAKGTEAWNRIIARNRQIHPDNKEHFSMVSAYSTPESFRFTYIRWKKKPGQGYKYVVAPTSSNPFVQQEFINNLRDTYTPEQCKAYLDGIWTNIFTGTVYSHFDRKKHNSKRTLQSNDVIHIGQDFNYGGSCGAVFVEDRDKVIMVDEFSGQDTDDIIRIIQDRFEKHQVKIYPDATGVKNSTNASMSDISALKQAGYQVIAKKSNPRITDRINSVQRMLYNNRFFINTNTCPETVAALEEHAFSDSTGLPEKFAGAPTIDDRNDALGYFIHAKHPIKKNTSAQLKIGGI